MLGRASRTIKSAHRVLEILEYFDQDRSQATVMEMSRALAYPQSSTSELLRCLARLGYLRYNRVRRTYCPTARVALLGAWVKPSLFRGGPVLSAIDAVAHATDETVVLSTNANYVVQHLHVIHGNSEHAVDVHSGDTKSMLDSPQGRLGLSSYRNEQIRSALHRLNADECDVEKQVNIGETIVELAAMRERGWAIEDCDDGTACVAVMLPVRRSMDRLVMSVQARSEAVQERGREFLDALLRQRNRIAALYDDEVGDEDLGKVVRLPEVATPACHRQFA